MLITSTEAENGDDEADSQAGALPDAMPNVNVSGFSVSSTKYCTHDVERAMQEDAGGLGRLGVWLSSGCEARLRQLSHADHDFRSRPVAKPMAALSTALAASKRK
jgi:hypothetical protein